MKKLAVFVSGRGSNLKSIVNKIESRNLDAHVLAVVSNKSDSPALEYAESKSISTFVISTKEQNGGKDYKSLLNVFKDLSIDLIVLAGFLKKIPDYFVDAFENRIINIHPALLPSFGGKGMYGMNVHRAVFKSSAKVSGSTVHFVNKVYDEGLIIAQRAVDISDVQSPEDIAARVLTTEHELLPFVIDLFSKECIKIVNNRVVYT